MYMGKFFVLNDFGSKLKRYLFLRERTPVQKFKVRYALTPIDLQYLRVSIEDTVRHSHVQSPYFAVVTGIGSVFLRCVTYHQATAVLTLQDIVQIFAGLCVTTLRSVGKRIAPVPNYRALALQRGLQLMDRRLTL